MKTYYNFTYTLDAPGKILEAAKNEGLEFSEIQIARVKNAVAYDVARKFSYSDQGIYICEEVLKEARSILDKKLKEVIGK